MNNKTYIELINKEEYPDIIDVPLDKPFIDERGIIQNLWLGISGSITLIESKKESIRANHYHINDWHATYIISGYIKYYERDLNENEGAIKPPQLCSYEKIFGPGSLFFTKPMVVHKMEFLEDTLMITINNIKKSHNNYENSVVRVKF